MVYSIEYCYWCVDEAKNISELKLSTDPVPTSCKNNAGHTLKAESVYAKREHVCQFTPYTGTDTNNLGTKSDATINVQELAQMLKAIIMCLEMNNLLEIV